MTTPVRVATHPIALALLLALGWTTSVPAQSNDACILVCPENITQDSEFGQCGATINYPQPTTSGNCANLTVQCTPAPGVFAVGTTTVHCMATNADGNNVAACSFDVTIRGVGAPQISYPVEITQCLDAGKDTANVDFSVEAKDSCGKVNVTCTPASGDAFPKGTTSVHCTATGVSGDSISASFPVTVNDCGGVQISCPGDISKCAADGKCVANVSFDVTATGGAQVVCSPSSGSEFAKGATSVTCTATDAAGKTATCSFKVTVNDCEPPKITCPADISKCLPAGATSMAVTYSVSATDNCGAAPVVCNPPSGATFAKGSTTVSCTASAGADQNAQCSFTVTVNDCPGVQITCPGDMTQCADPGKCTAAVPFTVTGSQGAQIACQPAAGSTFPKGSTTVSCTATDAGGNTAKCSFNVVVTDCEAPKITCPANLTKCVDTGKQTAVVNYTVDATDNCESVPALCEPKSGSTFPKGATTVACTATDAAGKAANCSFTVTVIDCTSPSVVCPGDITQCADAGQCTAVVNYSPNPAGFASVVCDPKPGSEFPQGTTTVTCNATDAAGHTTTCGFHVTVNACQPPKISSIKATPEVIWPPNHQMVPVSLDVVTDNCGALQCKILSVSSSEPSSKGPRSNPGKQWQVTGDLDLQLQAARAGSGPGRTYTVTVQCVDAAGVLSSATVAIPVAHDHSKLSHSRNGDDLSLSWDADDTESTLESTDSLTHPNWQPVVKGPGAQVTVPTKQGNRFFRLRQ